VPPRHPSSGTIVTSSITTGSSISYSLRLVAGGARDDDVIAIVLSLTITEAPDNRVKKQYDDSLRRLQRRTSRAASGRDHRHSGRLHKYS
jgi:hypothetical protein